MSEKKRLARSANSDINDEKTAEDYKKIQD
jgi:hypothetical protein